MSIPLVKGNFDQMKGCVLRVLASYERKIAFWPVIQLINHLSEKIVH